MNTTVSCDDNTQMHRDLRSQSVQGLSTSVSSPWVNIPMPPKLWITDVSDDSSNDTADLQGLYGADRPRMRLKYRVKPKTSSAIPIGFFWDIENCQVPRGCSAIDVVVAIRNKFLTGNKREADFVVVCDVRKEIPLRLQELNDSQVSLIHVCGTQKNAADEKLRQCMRRFGELHSAPAALVLISGDINFAGDLSDFRHRKNMEVILVHKQNTSSALIACATSHYNYNDITANLPRYSKNTSQSEPEEGPTCELVVDNLPLYQSQERVARRLKRLADNCGGKVLRVTPPTALLRFANPDYASRALKRMDGEDVFGRKISTRSIRNGYAPPTYSSDEGYGTAPAAAPQPPSQPHVQPAAETQKVVSAHEGPMMMREWALALQHLPTPPPPPAVVFQLPAASKPRQIRGTHGSTGNLDRSANSSLNSADDPRYVTRESAPGRAASPWNSSAGYSSDGDATEPVELTVTNLPSYNPPVLQGMLMRLFSKHVVVLKVSVWGASADGPVATVVLKSEWDARLAIARIHKRKMDCDWAGRRLELSLGRPSPAPDVDVLKARLKAILLDQPDRTLPLLRLRDAYASRHCCALTSSDIARAKDTVVVHESSGRAVRLIDSEPTDRMEPEEAVWRCDLHAGVGTGQEDASRILLPVYMQVAILAKNTQILLGTHGGFVPLLSFVECYEATFSPLYVDPERGVALELLLRSIPEVVIRETPSRHITWRTDRQETPSPVSQCSETSVRVRDRPRTAPVLEPMLALFERELVDLLKTAPRCTIQFSKLIPAFHHHFGRQCRVADYGFTKLPDLLAVLNNTTLVLGSGSSRVITMSPSAQARRWTSDLVKLLRAQLGRPVFPHDIPQLYLALYGRPFLPADYGVCTLPELMQRVASHAIVQAPDGGVALPRHTPTEEERLRTNRFAVQAVELLCSTPNLRMEFARFVPAYHAHFGRQLRVAHYGCVKLAELFELIPDAVVVKPGSGDRVVHLAPKPARAVVARRLASLSPVSVAALPAAYAARFGAAPCPDMLETDSVEALVFAVGGYVEEGAVRAPGDAPGWVTAALTACAVLSGDRSVTARGSTREFFVAAFEERFGREPNIHHLECSGVLSCADGRVQLTNVWRLVWRVALLLSRSPPLTQEEIYSEYAKRYEPVLPYADIGFENVSDFVCYFREVFTEDEHSRFTICSGVRVPSSAEWSRAQEDFSVHDTPPGQKGSRVFDSPHTGIWSSPPASALPLPTSLLGPDYRRRTRLAAHFGGA